MCIISKNKYRTPNNPGTVKEHTKSRDIKTLSCPGGGKHIRIQCFKRPDGEQEYADYSYELYIMLATPFYCSYELNMKSGRTDVRVNHCGERQMQRRKVSLGRFVLIFYTYFDQYRELDDSINRFMKDFPELNSRHEKEEAAHVNSYNWVHTRNNLMFMKRETSDDGRNPNRDMRDYIKWFDAGYDVFPIVNTAGEILMEVKTPFREEETYIKFKIPEDYTDFQLMLQGRIEESRFRFIGTCTGLYDTPYNQIKTGVITKRTVKNKTFNRLKWCKRKNKLLSIPDDQFITWDSGSPYAVLAAIVTGGKDIRATWILTNGGNN